MMFRKTLRISVDRVGALIGQFGKTKTWIEQTCRVNLMIDSNTGEVIVSSEDIQSNSLCALDIVQAIAHGFSHVRASSLLDETKYLETIDLKHYCGKSSNSLSRIKSRLIGEKGKTRRIMEETTNTSISIYGHFVSVIGTPEKIKLVEDAVDVLASGGQHKTAYDLLQRSRTRAKLDRLQLWEDSPVVEN